MSSDGSQVVLHARNIDPELKKKFKVWCAERGISMQKGLAMLIKAVVGDKDDLENLINTMNYDDYQSRE